MMAKDGVNMKINLKDKGLYKDSEISESDLNISVHDDSDTSDLIT